MSQVPLSATLRSLLQQGCKDLQVEDICYCYDIQTPSDWGRRMDSHRHLIRNFTKRRKLFASSAKGLSLWRQKVLFLKNMEEVVGQLYCHAVCVWSNRTLPRGMKRYLDSQQIEGIVTVSISCPVSPQLTGRFNLIMRQTEQVNDLLDRIDEVEVYLTRLQTKIALHHGTEINPLVDYNIISPISALILTHLANGADREEISSQLNLTLRGIDYHLSVLKQTLNARNIAQLVHEAGKLSLI
ncbi:hypothetical protein EKG38_08350 [Shewanella canadensis]|uniref:HTH luxR-type domain-containing protein n=1 Tax=Shewanella canadensis TaxID=271096 RepID=A0A3S0RZ56_9GAMM|nr:LuxR C-terminal-related transcriptional regulator [Shewanella canadensis]RTR39792.1 hypothetical protein EKG38_08350 [Shewanella canadensis]